MIWLAIAAGGACGAVARHALNTLVQPRSALFPVGIFAVNALGCLAAGVLAGLVASGRLQFGETTRLFVFAGVLGGFTTFSAYGLDTVTLARGGEGTLAAANAFGQVAVGLSAVWIGFVAASWRP
jgi:CrcB protein